jgi:hypothetical protein
VEPHFHFDVHAHLTANLPDRWIGRASENDFGNPGGTYELLCYVSNTVKNMH